MVGLCSGLGAGLGLYLSSPIILHVVELYSQDLISSRTMWQMVIWLLLIQILELCILASLAKQAVITNCNYFFAHVIFNGMLSAPLGILVVLILTAFQ
jgi:hypothetical protein